ncbi:MAG: SpoIID/LytB domain-containing protein [Gemmatimonadaceae bacterium]|nr:SpoIID/LytB domain-containing protein [Gemmatimonadaceae bacterium]
MTPSARRRVVLAALAASLPVAGSCFSRPIRDEGQHGTPFPVQGPTAAPRLPEPEPDPVEPIPRDPAPPTPGIGIGPVVRVGLRVSRADTAALAATGAWRLIDQRGGVLVRARAGERWFLERRGGQLRAVREGGIRTGWQVAPLMQYPEEGSFVRTGGRSYRGALAWVPTDTGYLAVNHVPLEDYLRGVVPLEIGERSPGERAAVEAQAIAARSYTVMRLIAARGGSSRSPHFEVVASVADQVYGGQEAERPLADAAVTATAGLVLRIGTRVVNAPFYSTCGGQTAAAEEVWRTGGEPHLRRVSDRIPGTDRHYCDIAPRFAWTRSWTGSELDAVVRRYLASVAAVGSGGPGRVTDLVVEERTPSGRVGTLIVRTDRGSYTVRGNDARSVLRSPGGEPLNSSYFSVTTERDDGRLVRAVIRGNGYGHGVGMCQWGAIGRARAGQDVRTILRTYYPGTTVGPVPPGSLTP